MSGRISLIVCGINHRSGGVEIRQPLQISRGDLPKANVILSKRDGVLESAIVATCNRIEFYMVTDNRHDPFSIIERFYIEFSGLSVDEWKGYFYTKKDRHAADHLFRVAAGVDSMVLGENHIQGQIREAYTSACNVKTAGKILHRLFHQAFRVGKQTRTDTELGRGSCSVSSASVDLLKSRLAEIHNPTIVLIGVNQMIALAASSLNRLGYSNLMFANRTKTKAEALARQYGGTGYPLEDLEILLRQADVVISCTSAKEPLIDVPMLDRVKPLREGKKLMMLDMAVPRDIAVPKDYGQEVEILDLDDVREFIKAANEAKMQAVVKAEEIIERRLDEFIYWYDHARLEPAYNGLDDRADELMRSELSPLFSGLPEQLRTEIEEAIRKYSLKLLKLKLNTGS